MERNTLRLLFPETDSTEKIWHLIRKKKSRQIQSPAFTSSYIPLCELDTDIPEPQWPEEKIKVLNKGVGLGLGDLGTSWRLLVERKTQVFASCSQFSRYNVPLTGCWRTDQVTNSRTRKGLDLQHWIPSNEMNPVGRRHIKTFVNDLTYNLRVFLMSNSNWFT